MNEHEPRPETKAPPCPKFLGVEGKTEWRRMVRILEPLGLVTPMDLGALAAYCAAWQKFHRAQSKLEELGMLIKTPKGFPMLSPYAIAASQAMKEMRVFLVEFGMSPSSRTRVKGTQHEPGDEDDNYFDTPLRRVK